MLARVSARCERLTWPAVILVAAAYFAALLRVAYWLGGLLRDAEVFLERAERGECTCTRHRVCAACLEELRGIRPNPEPERSPAA